MITKTCLLPFARYFASFNHKCDRTYHETAKILKIDVVDYEK
ncbi:MULTISPECIES: hypothetical protein [unclassified Microcoleus]